MIIQLNRDDKKIVANKVTIIIDNDVEFEFEINKLGELVVRKEQYGKGESNIIICPRVSNEIIIK